MDTAITSEDVNVAIPLYVGWQITSVPDEDLSRVASKFAPEKVEGIGQRVAAILQELNTIEPDWNEHSLASGSSWAVALLKAKFPFLDEEAVKALEWTFSWWWR